MNRTSNYIAGISAEIIQARRNTGAQSAQHSKRSPKNAIYALR